MGFPIRKSPDRRLLASPRGLSQLTTSFIACLRQGIHTHALSSLTIKSNSNTKFRNVFSCACLLSGRDVPSNLKGSCRQMAALLVVNNARQIFDCQRSDFLTRSTLAPPGTYLDKIQIRRSRKSKITLSPARKIWLQTKLPSVSAALLLMYGGPG